MAPCTHFAYYRAEMTTEQKVYVSAAGQKGICLFTSFEREILEQAIQNMFI